MREGCPLGQPFSLLVNRGHSLAILSSPIKAPSLVRPVSVMILGGTLTKREACPRCPFARLGENHRLTRAVASIFREMYSGALPV